MNTTCHYPRHRFPIDVISQCVWLYVESGKSEAVAEMSLQIFWLVLPSLLFFLVLPLLLRSGWNFWPSLVAASLVTAAGYFALLPLLRRLGVMST